MKKSLLWFSMLIRYCPGHVGGGLLARGNICCGGRLGKCGAWWQATSNAAKAAHPRRLTRLNTGLKCRSSPRRVGDVGAILPVLGRLGATIPSIGELIYRWCIINRYVGCAHGSADFCLDWCGIGEPRNPSPARDMCQPCLRLCQFRDAIPAVTRPYRPAVGANDAPTRLRDPSAARRSAFLWHMRHSKKSVALHSGWHSDCSCINCGPCAGQ
jgi:hypothetical protein